MTTRTTKRKRKTGSSATTRTARSTNLKRKRQPMPPDVRSALQKRALLTAYRERPDYQQNDYLGWIAQAKREATRQKRLDQMLDELERGSVYMNMRWKPVRRSVAGG